MKKHLVIVLTAVCSFSAATNGAFAAAAGQKGETLFRKYCLACHPQPANFVNRHSLGDIIAVMRNPSGAMPCFDEEKVAEDDALKIAAYIGLQRYLKAVAK